MTPRCEIHSVFIDFKICDDVLMVGDIGNCQRIFRSCVIPAPSDKGITFFRSDFDRCAIVAVLHPLECLANDLSVSPGRREAHNPDVGRAETRFDRHVRGDIRESQGVFGSGIIPAPSGKSVVVVCSRLGCHGCGTAAASDCLRCLPCHLSVFIGCEGHGAGSEGEAGDDVHVRCDILNDQRIPGSGMISAPPGEFMAFIRNCCHFGTVFAVFHCLGCFICERSVPLGRKIYTVGTGQYSVFH